MSVLPPLPIDELVARTTGPQPWRRILHALTGLLLTGILWSSAPSHPPILAGLGGIVAILLTLDLVRLTIPALNRIFYRLFHLFASPREATGIASSTWYMVGCLAVVALFSLEIAIPAILVLALADPSASYVGRRWGKRRLGTGTITGSIVFTGVAFLVLLPFVSLPIAAITALLTAAIESIPWRIDDNLTVPVAAGGLLWLLLPFGM